MVNLNCLPVSLPFVVVWLDIDGNVVVDGPIYQNTVTLINKVDIEECRYKINI